MDIYQDNKLRSSKDCEDSFWSWFNDLQKSIQDHVLAMDADSIDAVVQPGKATLQVGFIGYFGYEMKRESLPGYHWSPDHNGQDGTPRNAQFLFAQEVLRFDHCAKKWKRFALIRNGPLDPIASLVGVSRLGITQDQFSDRKAQLQQSMDALKPSQATAQPHPRFTSVHDKKSYTALIERSKTSIKEGDSYEMTLTTKFRAELGRRDCFGIYRSLRAKNPAPYSAFLDFPATCTTILSSSPERFISIDSRGIAEMKPIKGTVAVSKDPVEDRKVVKSLATDVKELAENLMVRDLSEEYTHESNHVT